MSERRVRRLFQRPLTLVLGLLSVVVRPGLSAEPPKPTAQTPSAELSVGRSKTQPDFVVETLAGRVVWLAEALKRRRQIQSVPEAADRVLALEAASGQLHPLVEDVRGRAFRRDPRLRDAPVELLVRRFTDNPFVQVIGVYGFDDGRRVELDYWCDVCAIAMYELKDCECCQGPIDLRRRAAR